MSDVKISELPLGIADADAVAVTNNKTGTSTEKIRLGDIVNLPHNHILGDINGLQNALDGKQSKDETVDGGM